MQFHQMERYGVCACVCVHVCTRLYKNCMCLCVSVSAYIHVYMGHTIIALHFCGYHNTTCVMHVQSHLYYNIISLLLNHLSGSSASFVRKVIVLF